MRLAQLHLRASPRLSIDRHIKTTTALFSKKILISDPIEQSCVDILEKAGYQITRREKVPKEELLKIIGEYDGLIVRSGTQVTPDIIKAGTKLKLIGRAGTGVDNIDVDTATRMGKMVMNTPGGNTASAAELTVSLLMALSRDIPNATQSLKAGKWERKRFMGSELAGKTIGIIGLGQIGRRVASACQGLGMDTIGFDPLLSAETARDAKIALVTLDELYARSDFISLHVPLTKDTKNMLNEQTFAKCKKGVRIVNCARGGIIDDAALLKALKSGHVAGAALDVFEKEPPPAELAPLLQHPNVICTPHLGASTEEAQEKVAKEIASQFVDAFEGRRYAGIVNAKILSLLHERKDLMTWVDLAERMGSLQAQLLAGAALKSVTLATRGTLLKDATQVLTSAALKGILSVTVSDPVNYVNANLLAEEFGLRVRQVHESKGSIHGNSVTIIFHTDQGDRKFVGTCRGAGGNQPRIVQVNRSQMELIPEGTSIFFTNVDKPGLMGRVCTILGEDNINISGFHLARETEGGRATGVVSVDSQPPAELLAKLREVPLMISVTMAHLPRFDQGHDYLAKEYRPTTRPRNPHFGSGPTSKYPGYSLSQLSSRSLGRSHRSKLGKSMLAEVIEDSKSILKMPKDYRLAIVPASDTGAFEMAMWSLLGPRPVDVFFWEAFGKGWAGDGDTLKLNSKDGGPGLRKFEAPYGKIPDLRQASPDHDVIFTWNGTTSGVRVPNADWIKDDRKGLTLCDATSAVFAMPIEWKKLDVVTWSWQKALGGEGAHGMLALSPRAVERLLAFDPPRPMPKIFQMKKKGKLIEDLFQGNVINTPSMLAVEDCIDALKWAKSVGGLDGMINRSAKNLAIMNRFVAEEPWIKFLAEDPSIRSSTSMCFTLNLPSEKIKAFTQLLEKEQIAYDIGSYRDAPPGIRIWGGSTVESEDLQALCGWLRWAYHEVSN
jgi:phosphoserine aminotransferase